MAIFAQWKWKKRAITNEERVKRRNLLKIMKLKPINEDFPISEFVKHDTVLLAGDGYCLPDDVKVFDDYNIPHDVYCVNRSLLFFQRPINHWGAVDCEESLWFSKYLNSAVKPPGHTIIRHTVGHMPVAYDVCWQIHEQEYENEMQQHLWVGNTGYFGILTSVAMGYKKIVLAGMPLDGLGHWYEHPDDTPAPNWVDRCYQQWMDYKIQMPEAERVRSMSGYSQFIFGEPTEEWLNGNSS